MLPNSRTRRAPGRVRNQWDIYDKLPAPIRAALQEGPARWDASVIASRYRKWRLKLGDPTAIQEAIFTIDLWHRL